MATAMIGKADSSPRYDHQVIWLDPHRIRPFQNQPRKRFRNIDALARSIKEVGQTTPVKVKLVDDDPAFEAELIDGERRLRACKLAGLQIKAEIDPGVGDENTQFIISVASNFGHEDHDNIEIALAIQRFQKQGKDNQQIADIFGKSLSWVSQHASLLKLHPDVQKMLVAPDDDEPENADTVNEGVVPIHRARKGQPQLTFSLAILIVPLPQKLQLEVAAHIAKFGLSLVSARRYILQLSEQTGHTVGRNRSPAEHYVNLEGMLMRMKDQVGIYLDMPRQTFQQILASQLPRTRQELARSLRAYINELEQLETAIK